MYAGPYGTHLTYPLHSLIHSLIRHIFIEHLLNAIINAAVWDPSVNKTGEESFLHRAHLPPVHIFPLP